MLVGVFLFMVTLLDPTSPVLNPDFQFRPTHTNKKEQQKKKQSSKISSTKRFLIQQIQDELINKEKKGL